MRGCPLAAPYQLECLGKALRALQQAMTIFFVNFSSQNCSSGYFKTVKSLRKMLTLSHEICLQQLHKKLYLSSMVSAQALCSFIFLKDKHIFNFRNLDTFHIYARWNPEVVRNRPKFCALLASGCFGSASPKKICGYALQEATNFQSCGKISQRSAK